MTWILLVSQTFFLQTEAEGEKKKKKKSIEKEQTKLCAAPPASSRRGPSQAHSERALYFGLAVHVSLLDAWSATRKALPANGSIMVIELPYCYKKQPDGEISQGCTGKRTPLSSHFKRTAALFFFSFFLCMGDKCMHAAFSRCYSAVCRPASCRLGDETGWTQSHITGLPPKGEPGTSTPQQAIEGRSRKASAKLQCGRY